MNAPDPLPPAPDDLWPEVELSPREKASFPAKRLPSAPREVSEALARTPHLEMYGAGTSRAWSEEAGVVSGALARELSFHSRIRAGTAARSLKVYEYVYGRTRPRDRQELATPQEVKAAATESFRRGLDAQRKEILRGAPWFECIANDPVPPIDPASLPEAPSDLWTDLAPKLGRIALTDATFGAPLDEVARSLRRSVLLEMQGAGLCAATEEAAAEGSEQPRADVAFHTAARIGAALRRATAYRDVHGSLTPQHAAQLPSPEQLRAAAILYYRAGLRAGRLHEQGVRLEQPEKWGFNDALYAQLRREGPGDRRSFKR